MTVVPLFQKPTQLGYRNTIAGVQDNPTTDGFTWNIEDWVRQVLRTRVHHRYPR